MAKLEIVEGIGAQYAGKLRAAGVATTEALLEAAATPKGRSELAGKTGIGAKLILEWANHVDLFRISGVGEEYADLLEEAGVDTIPELARRNPANLHAALQAANEKKKLVRQLAGQDQVAGWIEQAKSLPRKITY